MVIRKMDGGEMLLSTFQHLKGIGVKKELDLWCSGVTCWEDLEARERRQLSLFESASNGKKSDLFHSSRKALQAEDAEFFAERLPCREHYRIALSFPFKTLFLDIETTGLSRYYDTITIIGWSIGTNYKVHIKGDDDNALRRALSEAKAIVTFNGTLFDLPFLRQEFQSLQIPMAHIDLRFLARRVGLSGGQKNIEGQLGIKRPEHLLNLRSDNAPLLWYRYRQGDIDSLKLLISYNHADVEGMKRIFDVVIDRLVWKQQAPLRARLVHCFAASPSEPNWSLGEPGEKNEGIRIRPYRGKPGPAISLEDMASSSSISHQRIVGIDLTGSEVRPSGWCLLEANHVITRRICSDADLMKITLDAKPNLISIDSPLSLPIGRVTVDDNDPGRKAYGIIRYCEKILKKRGINVYPCLIKSMQNLTARGIYLAKQFRHLGIPVIESYPGAAQDIMDIPRKRANLEFLKSGLIGFGVRGDFIEHPVSHDELDAITSAIVGLFFWMGKFEALGNNEEEYLIIPDINCSTNTWGRQRVIGLSGPIAAGKTTAGQCLESRGFHCGRFSLVLADILRARGLTPCREALQKVGEEISKHPGQRWLCQELVRKLPKNGNLVIDGLRFPEDHALLVETFGPDFLHVHFDAPSTVRLERYISRGGDHQQFINASSRSIEESVSKMASLAHVKIFNVNSIESFLSKFMQTITDKQNTRGEILSCL